MALKKLLRMQYRETTVQKTELKTFFFKEDATYG